MALDLVQWKEREAVALSNGVVEAIVLAGGGHLAALRFSSGVGPKCNALWEAPWNTADPGTRRFAELGKEYGGPPAGPFLATFTGHTLCMDYFGPPEKRDEAFGATLHGEAATRTWQISPTAAGCRMDIDLPSANLHFSRSISLSEHGSVFLIEEQVENRSPAPRGIHWVQHLTLGPPLLDRGEAFVQASVDSCRSWPLGYEGNEVVADSVDFAWPMAPTLDGSEIDLCNPFERHGKGFVVAARVSRASPLSFIATSNIRIGITLLYCFRQEDFPWIAIWEENEVRRGVPWNGMTRARGMEFGTTPMPLGKEPIRRMGQLFDTPVERVLAARGKYTARYAICLATVAAEVRALQQVVVAEDAFRLKFSHGTPDLEIAAPEAVTFFGQEVR